MDKHSRIFVAGHRGLVGSAIVRRLQAEGYTNILTASRDQLDLREQEPVRTFFARNRPEFVFLAAAKVGGILANSMHSAEFMADNLAIQNNVIDAAYKNGARKLLFLGSSCIYPKMAPQPIREEDILTGPLEQTNESYAIAKIAGIKMCEAYRRQYGFPCISIMPTNLYGPGDNFDLQTSHVLPAFIRKFHEATLAGAPRVAVWGSGSPKRELLHVDDLADAAVFLMRNYDGEQIINVGTGVDLTIADLAQIVQRVSGYQGEVVFDRSKPDGTPRKLLDVSRLHALGWRHKIELQHGIADTYAWYQTHAAELSQALVRR
jgi:GDP-L-fucose synthase